MDLNNRVDRMDEEMKLLKNEIKQVLLEVQEHVLNAQNPFTARGGGAVFASGAPAAAPAQAGGGGGGFVGVSGGSGFVGGGGGGMGVTPSMSAPAVAQVAPEPSFADPALTQPSSAGPEAMSAPVAVAEEILPPSAGLSASLPPDLDGPSLGPDSSGPGLGPGFLDASSDLDGPSLGPDSSGPGLGPGFDDFDDEFDDDFDGPTTGESDFPSSRSTAKTKIETDLKDRRPKPGRDKKPREGKEVSTKPERDLETYAKRFEDDEYEPLENNSVASKGGEAEETSIDLITIAGLAQWCDRALGKIGRENLETLVQVSEITGRVSKEIKDVLMAILPLFDGKDDDVVPAKEIVSLLAQLDGLLASDPRSDSRLLPFILQDDTDFFPFWRQ